MQFTRPIRTVFSKRIHLSKRWNSTQALSLRSNKFGASPLFFIGGIAATVTYYKFKESHTAAKAVSGAPFDSSTTKLDDLSAIEYGSDEDFKKAFEEIEKLLGKEHISYSQSDFDTHSDSYYQTHHPLPGQTPKLIVYPGSTEEVSQVLKIAHQYRIPIVPFSGGTSLEGQFIASRSGITVDVNRLDQILELNSKDLDVKVQPSVGWQDLNEYLAPHDLLFGPDPGPGAQIGGMVATSCSGTNAARYGTMKENVLALTVVLADGTIVKTKKRPRKSSAGYNLTGLFVGSEGTLGIVTEITLKLFVKPEYETVAVVNFNSIKDATNSVSDIVSKGIQVNAVELLDSNMMKCINEVKSTSKIWLEKPTLLIKIGGSRSIANELISSIKDITSKNKSLDFQFAETEDEKAELWSARRQALWSTIDWGKRNFGEDTKVYITDVAVPISRLPTVISDTQDDLKASGFNSTILGHVGDGNFHALVLYQDSNALEVKKVVERMVKRALDNEGTCTGEHGVGVGKREFLLQELGTEAVDTMRRIKLALDPHRLLNADKIFKIDPQEQNTH